VAERPLDTKGSGTIPRNVLDCHDRHVVIVRLGVSNRNEMTLPKRDRTVRPVSTRRERNACCICFAGCSVPTDPSAASSASVNCLILMVR
jgi:hypothetical protein